jgi:hypothetical protein
LPLGRVIPFPSRGPTALTSVVRGLPEAASVLDEFSNALAQVRPHAEWSSDDWSLASVAVRTRLQSAQRQLDVLGQVDPADWPDTDWALDLDEARVEAEDSLDRMAAALAVLLRTSIPPPERIRHSRRLVSSLDTAIGALERLRGLIEAWHPPAGEAG